MKTIHDSLVDELFNFEEEENEEEEEGEYHFVDDLIERSNGPLSKDEVDCIIYLINKSGCGCDIVNKLLEHREFDNCDKIKCCQLMRLLNFLVTRPEVDLTNSLIYLMTCKFFSDRFKHKITQEFYRALMCLAEHGAQMRLNELMLLLINDSNTVWSEYCIQYYLDHGITLNEQKCEELSKIMSFPGHDFMMRAVDFVHDEKTLIGAINACNYNVASKIVDFIHDENKLINAINSCKLKVTNNIVDIPRPIPQDIYEILAKSIIYFAHNTFSFPELKSHTFISSVIKLIGKLIPYSPKTDEAIKLIQKEGFVDVKDNEDTKMIAAYVSLRIFLNLIEK